jgi:hypothetical protein
MKLYDSRLAPNPRRVRWFMAEKGVDDIEIVDVDLMAGAHKTPEYVGRAGIAQAAGADLDDGTTITESRRHLPLSREPLSRAQPVRPRCEGDRGDRDVDAPRRAAGRRSR